VQGAASVVPDAEVVRNRRKHTAKVPALIV
jgi:hypothetical protein